ncbi:MAG: tetratricopeptide repeat protein [Prochloraceae cyanobacterium]
MIIIIRSIGNRILVLLFFSLLIGIFIFLIPDRNALALSAISNSLLQVEGSSEISLFSPSYNNIIGRDLNVNNNTYNIREAYLIKDKEDRFLEKLKSSGVYDESDDPLTNYALAVDRIRNNDFQAAIKYYTNALIKNTFPEAYIGRGRAYLAWSQTIKKDPQKANKLIDYAIEDYTKALNLKPLCTKLKLLNCDSNKYVAPLLARSAAYKMIGNYDRSLADLNQAIELNPELYDAYLARANIYLNQQKYNSEYSQKAIDNLKIALRLNPDFPSALILLGDIQIKQ